MSDLSPQPALDDRTARQTAALAELAEIGMGLARLVQRQVRVLEQEAVDARTPEEMAQAAEPLMRLLDRVGRAVRLTFALEARLAAGPPARRPQDGAGPDLLARWRDEACEGRRQRKADVRQIVGAIIRQDTSDGVHDGLFERLRLRLEHEDEQSDFTWRPLGEMVARICRDLKLKPDWVFWNQDWAAEAARADERLEGFLLLDEDGEIPTVLDLWRTPPPS